ncbi:TPA: serine hydroxymethyltransferase [Candidatus Dojkabacteria bacterium]|uniref:Serine hydroxymethyltransferase n=1 Tax=Candidatus Dojkabacteria bacterium TaxID=2099670 RepID=A0A832QCL9_9BACT|nr:serine hydroxymethyltransferase [Candidatus Dojkabacteria bacterium]
MKGKNSVKDLIEEEKKRQKGGLELIASENYVSEDVLECMGSILTNKYSEGYPGKRYYNGNEYIDQIELLAISRAKELFGAEHVNVQPYSGSPANLAVHFALLEAGDRTLGMSLDAGGHLTHGFKVSISGKYYDSANYGLDDKGYIDYDAVLRIAKEHKPKLIWAGFSAYSRIVDWKRFREIADEVGAYFVADIAHVAGLVAGGVYPSPVPFADVVTTTTHKTLRGPRGAMILCKEDFAQRIDKAVFPGLQGGPHNHTIAGIATALGEASTDEFKDYAKQVVKNAQVLSEELKKYGYDIVSGGTDNHLFLMDVTSAGLSGGEAGNLLEKANITVNKNAIPNDTRKPWDPSGIRIGTPALTTRGMKEDEMVKVAEYINSVLRSKGEDEVQKIKKEVESFANKFKIPGIK